MECDENLGDLPLRGIWVGDIDQGEGARLIEKDLYPIRSLIRIAKTCGFSRMDNYGLYRNRISL